MLELFGLSAGRTKVSEADAIKEAQRSWLEAQRNTPEDESCRLVGKARGDWEWGWYGWLKDGSLGVPTEDNPLATRSLQGKRADQVIVDDIVSMKPPTMPGEFGERMCDGTFVLGFRLWDFRQLPHRMKLGRKPAPWCPKPWSKSKGVRA